MLTTQEKVRAFPIALVATPGGEHLAKIVDTKLRALFRENGQPCPATFIRRAECPRFQNGEGKGAIFESLRGTDLYLFVDVGNHGTTYTRNGQVVAMGPDEHYMDLMRLLGAAKNMPQRRTVIMPMLYEGRQHKLRGRESLDCAMALQQMMQLGVGTLMTIDAHNSHVQNAIPMHGLENLHATYQLIKAFLTPNRDKVRIHPDHLVVCSPDLGGMERARYFAEHFRVHLTGFYKVRDLTRVVDGKNPILEHKFLGGEVRGKDILVIDDLLASGGSMIEVCEALKTRGAGRIFISVTYALFSAGLAVFDQAYQKGLFDQVYGTNGTHIPPELRQRPWFVEVDVTKFIAKFIHIFNQDASITRLLDSTSRINKLLGRDVPNRAGGGGPAGAGPDGT